MYIMGNNPGTFHLASPGPRGMVAEVLSERQALPVATGPSALRAMEPVGYDQAANLDLRPSRDGVG